jgi:short subunit dehydrogenase-like uncharacterized protein
MSILIYGATGYTGALIARIAQQMGMPVTLAGRNEEKLRAVASETALEYVAVDLADTARLLEIVSQYSVVLHIAGPFSQTAPPMVEACLTAGTHYLDITGEIAVFARHRALDRRARDSGIMIMSGVGFDVVPSDCLSLHMLERMPEAVNLTLAMQGMGGLSHGTAKTAIEGINSGTAVRREGVVEFLKTPPRRQIQFGNRDVACVGVSWGDVETAYHTTGIPNIAVYFELTRDLERIVGLPSVVRWLLATAPGQALLRRQIEKQPLGPDPEKQKTQVSQILAIVEDSDGREMRSLLKTPGGYHLTALTALRIAQDVDGGKGTPGSHNPAQVFGANFIAEIPGCTITDVL